MEFGQSSFCTGYYPLFRVRSLNNGMGCMSFYILILSWLLGPKRPQKALYGYCVKYRSAVINLTADYGCRCMWPTGFLILFSIDVCYHIPTKYILDSKVHGAKMGPILGWQDPGGPHVGPMNLVIADAMFQGFEVILNCLSCHCFASAYVVGMCALYQFFLFVCFITKSFLTYSFFFSPTPALSTISRPLSSSVCSITPETANVGSSYNRMRGPGTGCWFPDRSNCSHWSLTLTFNTDQWEAIVIYHSITFTSPYTTILTPTTVVQGADNHSWGLYCRRCYWIRVCCWRSSQIFHFSRWLGQLSTIQIASLTKLFDICLRN